MTPLRTWILMLLGCAIVFTGASQTKLFRRSVRIEQVAQFCLVNGFFSKNVFISNENAQPEELTSSALDVVHFLYRESASRVGEIGYLGGVTFLGDYAWRNIFPLPDINALVCGPLLTRSYLQFSSERSHLSWSFAVILESQPAACTLLAICTDGYEYETVKFFHQQPRPLTPYNGIRISFGRLDGPPKKKDLNTSYENQSPCKYNKSLVPSVLLRLDDEWGRGDFYQMFFVGSFYLLDFILMFVAAILGDRGKRRWILRSGLVLAGFLCVVIGTFALGCPWWSDSQNKGCDDSYKYSSHTVDSVIQARVSVGN